MPIWKAIQGALTAWMKLLLAALGVRRPSTSHQEVLRKEAQHMHILNYQSKFLPPPKTPQSYRSVTPANLPQVSRGPSKPKKGLLKLQILTKGHSPGNGSTHSCSCCAARVALPRGCMDVECLRDLVCNAISFHWKGPSIAWTAQNAGLQNGPLIK